MKLEYRNPSFGAYLTCTFHYRMQDRKSRTGRCRTTRWGPCSICNTPQVQDAITHDWTCLFQQSNQNARIAKRIGTASGVYAEHRQRRRLPRHSWKHCWIFWTMRFPKPIRWLVRLKVSAMRALRDAGIIKPGENGRTTPKICFDGVRRRAILVLTDDPREKIGSMWKFEIRNANQNV